MKKDVLAKIKNAQSQVIIEQKKVSDLPVSTLANNLEKHEKQTDKAFWVVFGILLFLASSLLTGFIYLNQRIDDLSSRFEERSNALEDKYNSKYEAAINKQIELLEKRKR